jgi:hypothetical protein
MNALLSKEIMENSGCICISHLDTCTHWKFCQGNEEDAHMTTVLLAKVMKNNKKKWNSKM